MNSGGFSPEDAKRLTLVAYEAVKSLGVDVGNLRVSSVAVEFDLLTDSAEAEERAGGILSTKLGPLLGVRELDGSRLKDRAEAVREGISLFNEERYWESHEALESAWLTALGDDREVLQGIILVAAALVHLQKDEKDVALSILKRASVKLACNGALAGVDLVRLRGMVAQVLKENMPVFFRLPLSV